MFFETPISRRVGCHRWPKELIRLLTSLPENFSGQKPRTWSSRVWTRRGLFRLRPSPPVSFAADKSLCTWFLCLVPGSTVFGGFCVRQPSLPRVSTRFFGSLPSGGIFWP